MTNNERTGPPWLPRGVDIDAADRLFITLTLPPLRGETEPKIVNAPLNAILAIRELVTSFGDRGFQMAVDAALLGITVRTHQPTKDESQNEIAIIMQLIQHIQLIDANIPEQISHQMLREGRWTRPEAAKNASALLGREIATDTWRKRIDAYERKHKELPKIDLPTGRRKKSENI